MIRQKYMPRALGLLLLVVLSPVVAQQNDDNEIIVSASRSNRTVAEMAQ
ncbi:TonB-dependent siderophore receptor, partial [Salmonella enterica subsp. enterica serovar Kentucky]|nr:TonB-dependent siderophore receptor [Salmonella enterica subsp. enterica serovar Kentucky]